MTDPDAAHASNKGILKAPPLTVESIAVYIADRPSLSELERGYPQ